MTIQLQDLTMHALTSLFISYNARAKSKHQCVIPQQNTQNTTSRGFHENNQGIFLVDTDRDDMFAPAKFCLLNFFAKK